jgi:hypothetical protein
MLPDLAFSRQQRQRNEYKIRHGAVFGGNNNKGRIFVLTNMGWFERIEDQSGAVAFTTIAQSESELREYISRDDPSADLVQLGGKYKEMVSEEFMEQLPQYRDSPEYSDEAPLEEDSQQYHQHD